MLIMTRAAIAGIEPRLLEVSRALRLSPMQRIVKIVIPAALPRIKSRLAKLNPAPTREIPILIGGQGERKTLRLVAEYADQWHGFTNADTYPGKAEVLARHCADVGRDPATIERSSGVEGNDTDTLVANAEALAGLGVTMMTVGCDGPDYDLGPAQALIRWRDSR